MATLYELSNQYLALLEMAEDPETDPVALEDTMESLDYELSEKADGYAIILKELESRAKMLSEEADRLKAREKACTENIRRLKLNLQNAMESTGKEKIKTDRFTFYIQNNTPSVVMDAEWEKVPETYLLYKDPTIDKVKIKKDIQAGMDLSGIAHLEQGRSLRIK